MARTIETIPADMIGYLKLQLAAAQRRLDHGRAAGGWTWPPERITMQMGIVSRWERWLTSALAVNRRARA